LYLQFSFFFFLETPQNIITSKNQLKCEVCTYSWIGIETDRDVYMINVNNRNICSVCSFEDERRQIIVNNYSNYFDSVGDMYDIRHKDLYLEVFRIGINCCICNNTHGEGYGETILHYSLGSWKDHLVCSWCFDRWLANTNLIYYCACGYKNYVEDVLLCDDKYSDSYYSQSFD
jgi:hypothetical protein